VLLADFWAAGRARNPLDFVRWVVPIKARGRYTLCSAIHRAEGVRRVRNVDFWKSELFAKDLPTESILHCCCSARFTIAAGRTLHYCCSAHFAIAAAHASLLLQRTLHTIAAGRTLHYCCRARVSLLLQVAHFTAVDVEAVPGSKNLHHGPDCGCYCPAQRPAAKLKAKSQEHTYIYPGRESKAQARGNARAVGAGAGAGATTNY
jgi:hypothetical protein